MNDIQTFKFWCQKVLPAVYDESLSYYETLCKVTKKLNELIEVNNKIPEYIENLIKEFLNSDIMLEIISDLLTNYVLNVKRPPNGITPASGNGTTDDTNSIQDCIDYANSHSGMFVYFPSGSYLTQSLTIRNNVSLVGGDKTTTKIVLKGGATTALITGNANNYTIKGLTLDANMDTQVNDVNLIDVKGGNLNFSDLSLKDGYTLLNIDVLGNININNIEFIKAVVDSLVLNGNGFVNCNNIYFYNLSALSGRYVIMNSVNNAVFSNINSQATTITPIFNTGNNCVFIGRIANSTNVIDDSGSNTYTNFYQKGGTLQNSINQINNDINELKLNMVKLVDPSMTQDEIQNILDNYLSIKFLSGTYNVTLDPTTLTGFFIPSNRIIEFEDNAIIQANSTDLQNYRILNFVSVENVKLINATVIGERLTHIGTLGEWGHGINLEGCSDITFENCVVTNCWGDGIYIGSSVNGVECSNITINNITIDNTRRNGISVISVNGLYINGGIIKNINGTLPQAGIDFEPNNNTQVLKSIFVENLRTKNCSGSGMVYTPFHLEGSNEEVVINVNNHNDYASLNGVWVLMNKAIINGRVTFNNCTYVNNKNQGIYVLNYGVNGPRVDFLNPVIINSNRVSYGGSPYFDSSIMVFRNVSGASYGDCGNIHIIRPTVRNDNTSSIMKYVFTFFDNQASQYLKRCSLIDPVSLGVANTDNLLYENVTDFVFTDAYGQCTLFDQSINMYISAVYKKFVSFTSNVSIALQSGLAVGTEVTFQVLNTFSLAITLPPTEYIRPNQSTAGKGISSNVIGSLITLRKVTSTNWVVVNTVGTWTNTP